MPSVTPDGADPLGDHHRGCAGVAGDGHPQGLAHALGHAGGPRRVQHLAPLGLVVERRGATAGQDPVVGREAGDVPAGGDAQWDAVEVE